MAIWSCTFMFGVVFGFSLVRAMAIASGCDRCAVRGGGEGAFGPPSVVRARQRGRGGLLAVDLDRWLIVILLLSVLLLLVTSRRRPAGLPLLICGRGGRLVG